MGDWQDCALGDLVKFKGGSVFPKDAQGLTSGDLPFAKVSDMNAAANWRSLTGAENWLSVDQARTLKATIHEPGAVAFAKIGIALTYNRRRQIVRPTLLDNNMMSALPYSGKLNSGFLYYLLQTIDFNKVSAGSALPYLTVGTLNKIAVSVPSIEEQRSIACLLSSLDDKIELNRQMSETLEVMAQAIFRDWFVDYGPVRRKLDGATDAVEIIGGLVSDADRAREFADLFPAKLGDDGLPEGWEERQIGDLAKLRGGKQLPKSDFADGGRFPVFGGAGLMGFTNQHNAEGYVITVGRVGAYCGRFFAHRGKAWVNNNASHIIPNGSTPAEWLFIALRHLNMDVIKKGAAQPFVSNGDLATQPVVYPGGKVLKAFQHLTLPLIGKIENLEGQSETLAATRDLLLPKLMSGEIRLRDAEAELEAAQ